MYLEDVPEALAAWQRTPRHALYLSHRMARKERDYLHAVRELMRLRPVVPDECDESARARQDLLDLLLQGYEVGYTAAASQVGTDAVQSWLREEARAAGQRSATRSLLCGDLDLALRRLGIGADHGEVQLGLRALYQAAFARGWQAAEGAL